MKYNARMLAKMSLIFFGLLFFVCVWLGRRERASEMLEGDKISCRDVGILMEALNVSLPDSVTIGDTDSYLTYSQYIMICREIGGEAMHLPDYADRYEPDYPMLKRDWYSAFKIILAYLDTESSVWETEIFLLKIDEDEKKAYTENNAFSEAYVYESSAFEDNVLHSMRVYVCGETLLTVVEVLRQEHELRNVWVTESSEGNLECFYHQTAFHVDADETVERERIADLTFIDGRVVKAKEKNDKIHGKLLWISDEKMEIEGFGVYPIEDGMEVYKLYGSLETLMRSDLRIGYSDTDYVVEKGKVCACLVSEREEADMIRVLLKNTAANSKYYDSVELTIDGETVLVSADDLKVGERRNYRCDALTDRVAVSVEGVTKEDNAYRGTIECYRSEGGMVLINELPLEEYLYAVVPSEMPASYPSEALKAQAICARTYAYLYILRAGFPELGAHVDDTTSYQVYHNIRENAATTAAVRDTDGMLLIYQNKPAQNYYYSTSCGVGTDTGIWKSGGMQDTLYMQSTRLNLSEHESYSSDDLRDEDNFFRFISSVNENDLESDEPWYRWTYEVSSIDTDEMLTRIQERYAASPQSVLTKAEGDYYVSQPVEKLGSVRDISIVKRGSGGVADELLIVTDSGTYKILAEYNIRCVLCDRKSEAVRHDGSTVIPTALLPSGFFVIKTGKSNDSVVGYTLIGGGYGHGVGMSQNGAKALGQEGADCEQILTYFFAGCELQDIAGLTGQ